LALLAWLLCALVMLWLFHGAFPHLAFRDPDDAMRLQQVRDWLNGQAFQDVSQHRVNPPIGGPMHWSRIVDIPVALLILLTRPFAGAANAEIFACAVAPLLLLGGLTFALHLSARRIGGSRLALLAVALLLTAPSILVQFTPLRIDHHGWQIMTAAFALAGVLDPRPGRGGLVAGLALAVWLQISSEGLPYAALIGGLFALRQWIDAGEAPRFTAYAGALGGAAFLLLLGLKGLPGIAGYQCDALSAVYAWPLLAFAMVTPVAMRLLGTATGARRLGVAALGGGAAVIVFTLTGGPCLKGDPFAALGPVAYRLWYMQVKEGQPIWDQGWSMVGVILLPSLAGLAGALVAARVERERRVQWLSIALLIVGAVLVSIMVMRAMSVAHLFALPGLAWLLIALFARAQALRLALARVLGSVALMALTPVGLCALWIALVPAPAKARSISAPASVDCRSAATLAPLRSLRHAVLFAPIDMGPDILVQSGHSVIATAHHRNAAGITAVIEGFILSPDRARAIIGGLNGGRGADYVVTCAGLNEMTLYAKDSPGGLAAALEKGKVPAWLRPAPAPAPLHIYRVVR
jgi:hypothetical protein